MVSPELRERKRIKYGVPRIIANITCGGKGIGKFLVAPVNLVVGVGYEVVTVLVEIATHGPLSWLADTPGDIAANAYGTGASLVITPGPTCEDNEESQCLKACGVTQGIPGPDAGDKVWY